MSDHHITIVTTIYWHGPAGGESVFHGSAGLDEARRLAALPEHQNPYSEPSAPRLRIVVGDDHEDDDEALAMALAFNTLVDEKSPIVRMGSAGRPLILRNPHNPSSWMPYELADTDTMHAAFTAHGINYPLNELRRDRRRSKFSARRNEILAPRLALERELAELDRQMAELAHQRELISAELAKASEEAEARLGGLRNMFSDVAETRAVP